jgi:hypothetical protein
VHVAEPECDRRVGAGGVIACLAKGSPGVSDRRDRNVD